MKERAIRALYSLLTSTSAQGRDSRYNPMTILTMYTKYPSPGSPLYVTGFLGFFGFLCLTGSVVLLVCFRDIVEYFVSKQVVLNPNALMYNMWKEPPIPIYLKLYFFNVSNPEEFPWHNTKPSFQDIGPYVYREHWKRVGIRWHDNGTVTCRRIRTFTFVRNMSIGSEEDIITTINIPVLTAANLFKTAGPLVKFALSSVFRVLHETFFVHKSVRELTFEGYDDPLIKVARDILGTYPFTKFGYFSGTNNSDDGLFNLFTGMGDTDRFTLIDKWNGKSHTKLWTSKYCNKINGTDGSTYPPMLDGPKDISIFVPDFCRSFKFQYVDSTTYMNIPAYTYETINNIFDNGTTVPGNECYCSGRCLDSGVVNISLCQYGAPIFISFPHFYEADPSYVMKVEGLRPNKSLHSSAVTIEPLSGVPLNMSIKFQLNAYVENIPHFTFYNQLDSMLLPLAWFTQDAKITDDIADMIYSKGNVPLYYGKVVIYCMLGLGMLLSVSSVLYYIVARKPQNKNDNQAIN